MSEDQAVYWKKYYQDVFKKGDAWLDYSNDRVQAQTFGLTLEAAGPLAGKRCLDIGCGRGQFSLGLSALGAAEVTGVDIVSEAIEQHRKTHPELRWECAGLEDEARLKALGSFDVVFAIEVLQYADIPRVLGTLWGLVAPGGRLVAVVPNGKCPIVAKARERFGNNFLAPSAQDLAKVARKLESVEWWGLRGMHFQKDQGLVPYAASDWAKRPAWKLPPNRLQLAVSKKS